MVCGFVLKLACPKALVGTQDRRLIDMSVGVEMDAMREFADALLRQQFMGDRQITQIILRTDEIERPTIVIEVRTDCLLYTSPSPRD